MSDNEKINRLDPLWGQIVTALLDFEVRRADAWDSSNRNSLVRYSWCANHADAMIRERDRRDREERP